MGFVLHEVGNAIRLDTIVQKTVAYAGKSISFKVVCRLNAYVSTNCSCTGEGSGH